MKTKYLTNIYTEICCDFCNEIIHTHFECPICKNDYAGTTMYGDPWDEDSFTCEECGSQFVLADGLKIKDVSGSFEIEHED